MVSHQHVSMDRAVVLGGSFGEFAQIAGIIAGSSEARLPVVSALDDVLGDSGQVYSGLASHERNGRGQ